MTRVRVLLALALAVVGCESSTTDDLRFDASARDTGAVADVGAVDSGATTDAPRADAGTDAWVNRTDGGTGAGPCNIPVGTGSFGPIPATCLPRCSSETGTAYLACTDNRCRTAAVQADTTPGILYSLNTVSVRTPLDCVGCVSYAQFACFGPYCPRDVDAYVDNCLDSGSDAACDAALRSLNVCLGALTEEQGLALDACFASDIGPAGCF